jgi:hypothetical protein
VYRKKKSERNSSGCFWFGVDAKLLDLVVVVVIVEVVEFVVGLLDRGGGK